LLPLDTHAQESGGVRQSTAIASAQSDEWAGTQVLAPVQRMSGLQLPHTATIICVCGGIRPVIYCARACLNPRPWISERVGFERSKHLRNTGTLARVVIIAWFKQITTKL